MSRAELNLAVLAIDRDETTLEAFDADPTGFVQPYRLSTEERRALETWDHGALYALGAHPFILWQAVRSISLLRDEALDALVERYRAAVVPHGRPDFTT
ncbi:MAG: hypothetical protein ACFCVC_06570 [Acidimicrobiia bacterium]